jgi:hypothetical protein
LSHHLDTKSGRADFVRLSFCKKHPMMYLALKDGRISRPVVLEIKLEVVSRPGVLFCAINAASTAAKTSEDPSVIHFGTVKASSQRTVAASEKSFFQGEVLVPDCIPPHLIKIPKVDAFAKPLELRGRLPDSFLVGCASGREIGVRDPNPSSLPFPLHQTVAAGAGSSAPEPLISLREVHSARIGKSKHETFAAPKPLGNFRIVEFSESSNLRKLQRERKQKLENLVDPHHVLQATQFGYDVEKSRAWMLRKPRPVQAVEPARGCEMPLTKSASCGDCKTLGRVMACPRHMRLCGAPAFVACDRGCGRTLCWEHGREYTVCYCKSQVVGIGGAAERERASAREREIAREREEREREMEWR